MPVADIIKEQDEMKAHEHFFVLWPKQWITYPEVHDWHSCKLVIEKRNEIPEEPGIYTLLVQPSIANHPASSYLMYVGRTNSLQRRFTEYLNERYRETGRPKIVRILNKYSDYMWFCFTLASDDNLITMEKNLIKAYIPPANDQYPAEIRRTIGAFR